MTTTTAPPVPAPRFGDLLAAEWLKLLTLRSTYWALGIGALAVIAFGANAARTDYVDYPHYNAMTRAHFHTTALFDAFTDGAAMILVLTVASVGAITVVGEYSTGLIRTTFAAVPDRRALTSAKAAAVTGLMTGYGFVVAGASFGVSQAILSGRHAGLSVSDPGALRVITASALLARVSALTGMALGALIRHSATTMVLTAGVLLLLPQFVTDRHHWTACVRNALPFHAWERLVQVDYGHMTYQLVARYPTTVGGAWVVFGVWAVVSGGGHGRGSGPAGRVRPAGSDGTAPPGISRA